MCPHLIDGVSSGLHTNISQDAVLWVEEFAEALKEEHVRAKFSLVLVLDAEEHIVIALCPFVYDFGGGFIEIDAGIAEIIILQANGI